MKEGGEGGVGYNGCRSLNCRTTFYMDLQAINSYINDDASLMSPIRSRTSLYPSAKLAYLRLELPESQIESSPLVKRKRQCICVKFSFRVRSGMHTRASKCGRPNQSGRCFRLNIRSLVKVRPRSAGPTGLQGSAESENYASARCPLQQVCHACP
ncbi:uncharacterized protein EI90DRAFT_2414279 [Cantharellus anzutake]|uniref:uncharacterized protein n=1 Tax=Cantharellus anzutake TaxID=1750568 RepID=UPI00190499D6|nr:uncharacterized protein EI90DRAFT_2414279 [Cantharellus anzutake]KAF8338781.1 hypothetical protein EI90DRAFT_2414279 [Cantharellus anzutake]